MQGKRKAQIVPCAPLPPQLRVDDRVLEPSVCPVRNDAKSLSKPRGGFWTSTYHPHYGSGWVRYCIAYRYNEPFELHWIVLRVPTSARVAVIDIDASRLPSSQVVESWTSEQFVAALRHDPRNPAFNSSLRQLIHVGYKIAAQMGDRYLKMLEACEPTVARNVTGNLYDRHLKPLFIEK